MAKFLFKICIHVAAMRIPVLYGSASLFDGQISCQKVAFMLQECAYLCNMAVDAEYRRRGYGNILLDAADDIADIAGQRDIYLHLRFVLMRC